jgi:hypothetical protein
MSSIPTVKSESNLSDSGEITVATDSSESSYESQRVSFGAIHVREFERIVGDHPETLVGVPLSLGWAYHQKGAVSIETYESDRIRKGNLRMSSITRKNILHNVFGIPEDELRAAEKEVQKIKKSKERSSKQSKFAAKKESALKRVGRKIRRALTAEHFIKGLSAAASSGLMLSMPNQ